LDYHKCVVSADYLLNEDTDTYEVTVKSLVNSLDEKDREALSHVIESMLTKQRMHEILQETQQTFKKRNLMEPMEIKDRIHDTIAQLPPQKLRIALDFLEDLRQSDEEATEELLYMTGFMEEYRQAKEDIRTGKTISWEDIKRNV